jgi:hypothetical protein
MVQPTKSELFGRSSISNSLTPRLGSEDVGRIQEIRTERFIQQQERQLGRQAEPIKKRNLEQINSKISNFENKLNLNKQRIERVRNSLDKAEGKRRQRLDEEIEELREENIGIERGIKELREGKNNFEKFNVRQILANQNYSNDLTNYAEDLKDSIVERSEYNKRLREKGYSKNPENWTKDFKEARDRLESVKIEDYGEEWKKLDPIVRQVFLNPMEIRRNLEKIKTNRELTSLEKQKVQAWMDKNKMTPTPDTIREIINRPIESIKTNIAYRNILTGEIQTIDPEIAKSDPLLKPIYIDSTGRELVGEQAMLSIERPDLVQTFDPAGKPIYPSQTFTEIGQAVEERVVQPTQEFLIKKVQETKIKNIEKEIKQIEKYQKEFNLTEFWKNRLNELKGQKDKLEKLKKRGVLDAGSIVTGFALDYGVPLSLGTVGVIYDAIQLSPLIFKKLGASSKIVEDTIRRLNKAEKMETKTLANQLINSKAGQIGSLIVSSQFNNLIRNNIDDLRKIKSSNNLKQYVDNSLEVIIKRSNMPNSEQLSKNKQLIENAGKQVLDKLEKFYWQSELLNEENNRLKEVRDELKSSESEIEKKTLRNIETQTIQNIENIKSGRAIKIGATALLLVGIGIELYRRNRRIKNIELDITKRQEALEKAREFNALSSDPIKIVGSEGIQFSNTYTGELLKKRKLLDDLPDIIKKTDISRVQITAGSEAYQQTVWEVITRRLDDLEVNIYPVVPKDKIFFKNSLTYNVFYNNGDVRSFTFLGRNNKPINRFKDVRNAIKYGKGKKFVISSSIKDSEIVESISSRIYGGRLFPDESLITRRTGDFIETRRTTRARDIANMTPEEYWKLSPRKSVTQITKEVKGKESPFRISAKEFFFSGTRQASGTRTRSISTGLTIDTGTVQYVINRQLEILKRQNKTGTKSFKTLRNIKDKVEKAVKSGESSVTIGNKLIKKLDNQVVETLRLSQTAVQPTRIIPRTKIKKVKNLVQPSLVNKINRQITSLSSRINRLSNNFESKRFLGNIRKKDISSFQKEISSIKPSLRSELKILDKTKEKLEEKIKEIERLLKGVVNSVLERDLNMQRQLNSQLTRQRSDLRLRLKQLEILERTIINIGDRIRTPDRTRIKIPRIRIPRFGFPSDSKKQKSISEKDDFNAYISEVREKGKWKQIGMPDYKWKAKKRGIEKTGKDLSQSFRIRKTNIRLPKQEKEFVNLDKYYKKKEEGFDVWIEKPKAKIDSPQEKSKLKRARIKSKRERQFRKKVNDYWGFK